MLGVGNGINEQQRWRVISVRVEVEDQGAQYDCEWEMGDQSAQCECKRERVVSVRERVVSVRERVVSVRERAL
jgi:hypothetical protein